jgi:preprotein translocase subunit SecA
MQAHHIDATTGHDDVGGGGPQFGSAAIGALAAAAANFDPKKPETWGSVSRNDACPCNSGKKYKHCHGAYV